MRTSSLSPLHCGVGQSRNRRCISWLVRFLVLCFSISGAGIVHAASYSGSVSGNLFYNDMRYYGCHKWRFDPSGNPGERDPKAAKPSASHDEDAQNWLGAYDVRVEVYEKEIIGEREQNEG